MSGNAADAEDAVNTAMLKALQRYSSLKGELLNEKAWLSRILHNVCMDIHRERQRRGESSAPTEDAEPPDRPCLEPGPDESLFAEERARQLRECIQALPPNLRKPLTMRFLQDMSYADIAVQLQLTNCNVRKRIQLAYSLLRESLPRTSLLR